MTRPDLSVVDVYDVTDDPGLIRRAFETVLRPSFTADELPDIAAVHPGEGEVFSVALDADGEPVAAAVSEIDPDGVSLLGYIAARPEGRGRGAGGFLLAHLRDLWRAAGCPLVLAEVHDPRGHAEGDDERPAARLRFYGRGGAEVLGVPWVQPALTADTERVPDMLLLVTHRARPATAGAADDGESDGDDGTGTGMVEEVPAGPVLAWALEYFTSSEGAAPQDPQGRALLDRIRERETIPVLAMDHWSSVPMLGEN